MILTTTHIGVPILIYLGAVRRSGDAGHFAHLPGACASGIRAVGIRIWVRAPRQVQIYVYTYINTKINTNR